jgi:hypothetical protein
MNTPRVPIAECAFKAEIKRVRAVMAKTDASDPQCGNVVTARCIRRGAWGKLSPRVYLKRRREMRHFGLFVLTGFVAALAFPSKALPYYVRSIANVTTSGNISNGQSFNSDTGQVQTTSNGTGVLQAHSQGGFYIFDSTAKTTTEIGAVHGFVTVDSLSSGPAGGSTASAQGQWNDTITITSNTLASGTPVSFQATVTLHRTISGALPAQANASITGPFGLSLIDSLSSPNATQSVSTVVNTTVGSSLSATSTMTLSAGASGIAPFDLSASIMAENTAVFSFVPITPGASYSTGSGVVFVPEPMSALMMVCGAVVLASKRRPRENSRHVQTFTQCTA